LTFSDIDELESDDEDNPKKEKNADKPAWYREIFLGNTDDDFSLGITLHDYHGQFEIMSKVQTSDIIIATPLGIRRENTKDKYEKILSSVELCIVDQSDVILMQNWEHLVSMFENLLNKTPTASNAFTFDFTKIRDYFVYGLYVYFLPH
jgi:U3 small nucleolar RNA-associated protein 25